MSLWSRLERRLGDLASELVLDEYRDQLNQARHLMAQGDVTAAIDSLEALLSVKPDHGQALIVLGEARLVTHDATAAHEAFERAYWERWRELLAGPFQIENIRAIVEDFQRQLAQAEPRNRARWPSSAPRDNDLAAETAALTDWLKARLVFIESQLGTLP